MRKWIRLCALLCVSGVCVFVLCACRPAAQHASVSQQEKITYLVVGLDDAACNADVCMLACLDRTGGQAHIVQIPRDTYLNQDGRDVKLNSLYATYLCAGENGTDAMEHFCSQIRALLGIRIDGWFAFTTEAFRACVDAIGGVKISLPEDLVLTEENGQTLHLCAGEHTLDAVTAQRLIRHRKSYANGDLGRLDVQKLFLKAFFTDVRARMGAGEALSLLYRLYGKIHTDVAFLEAARLLVRDGKSMREAPLSLLTLPGAPAMYRGCSYYVLNRDACRQVCARYLDFQGTFDPAGILYTPRFAQSGEIYRRKNMSYRVFSKDGIQILTSGG